MRRAASILALTAVAAAVTASGGGAAGRGFAFGRIGGNIRPYTVTIASGGAVRVSGPVTVGRRQLDATQLAALTRAAAEARFAALPGSTQCAGTLPDVASTFIRVGARRVRVHGSCLPRYNRLWRALGRAVRLSGG